MTTDLAVAITKLVYACKVLLRAKHRGLRNSRAAERVKARKSPPLNKHLVLSTRSLVDAQSVTSRLWSKHASRVTGKTGYSSDIFRHPLGRSWLCFIDCRTSMHVEPEGNATKCFVYVPSAGSMKIFAQGKRFSARPGGPFFLPVATPHVFDATPIKCVLLEIPATKLRTELTNLGWLGRQEEAISWEPDSPAAKSIDGAICFVLQELERGCPDEGVYPRRLEALIVACLAKEIVAHSGGFPPADAKMGKVTVHELKRWISERIRADLTMAELSAFTGLKPRALQQQFLKNLHTAPLLYVRDQRLEAARRELRDSGQRNSVSELAANFKFHHLGRFASAYRRKFGESPSATRRDALRGYPKSARK